MINSKIIKYSKIKGTETKTVDLKEYEKDSSNIFESIVIMGKRARQINNEIKQEFNERVIDVVNKTDNLEEVDENKEQIELSKKFERIAKPSLISMKEFKEDKIYYRYTERNN